jgi:hypothetical protein
MSKIITLIVSFIILVTLLVISAYSLTGLNVCSNSDEAEELKIKQAKSASIAGIILSSLAVVGIISFGIFKGTKEA